MEGTCIARAKSFSKGGLIRSAEDGEIKAFRHNRPLRREIASRNEIQYRGDGRQEALREMQHERSFMVCFLHARMLR